MDSGLGRLTVIKDAASLEAAGHAPECCRADSLNSAWAITGPGLP